MWDEMHMKLCDGNVNQNTHMLVITLE
jgi:hypothetical protein